MQTTNKVQTGDTVTGTSTSTGKTTSTYYTYDNPSYNAEQGWECPRCGRINAPWVRQCNCNRGWNLTCDDTIKDEWWKEYVTSDTDTFKIHPDNITWCGGSDYKDSATGDWVNVPKTYTYTNSVKR